MKEKKDTPTTLEFIYQEARLHQSKEAIVRSLVGRLSVKDLNYVKIALDTEDSAEWAAYQDGYGQLERKLMEDALEGKKDGFKNLEQHNRKNAINKSLKKNFGIGDDDD